MSLKRLLIGVVLMGLAGVSAVCAKPMNVVFILADDLGWADTTLYGHTDYYKTPNLERLAKRGMTFNRAYANSPLCSPTRASILTGQTPARHGSTAPQHHLPEVRLEAEPRPSAGPGDKSIQPHSASRLDTDFPTLGKMMYSWAMSWSSKRVINSRLMILRKEVTLRLPSVSHPRSILPSCWTLTTAPIPPRLLSTVTTALKRSIHPYPLVTMAFGRSPWREPIWKKILPRLKCIFMGLEALPS